ncbi:MAG: ABC transporter substrate-binding protein [Ferruginibacter sp.]|nr:ABC transporter substrate-binding protein [Ferruginibacter sp.]
MTKTLLKINLLFVFLIKRIYPILFLIMSVGLCACYQDKEVQRKIFRYNETAGITSLDPAFARNQANMWIVHQLYNTLVEVNDKMEIVPSLASRWQVSKDGKEWTFTLRNDVFFHDSPAFRGDGKGRRLTAKDVEYSFNRIIDPATASPGAWIFNNRVDEQHPFVALNDSVFRIKLKVAFHPILGILSMQYCSIVPQEAVLYYGTSFRNNPVGSGPFCLVKWVEGQALICKKNVHYFEKDEVGNSLPYLDGIHVSFADSKATEFLLFRQGKLDFINDIDASFKDEVLTRSGNLRKEWNGKVLLNKHPYFNIEYLGISLDTAKPVFQQSPLRLKKVRQAMQYAIDKNRLMLYLRNSIGTPAYSGFIPIGFPAFDSSFHPNQYNLERAKKLLIEAGYHRDMPAIVLNTIPQYANLGVFIINELEKAGMNVQLNVMQKSLLLQQMAAGDINFFRGSWIADYPDAENYLSVFYGDNPAPPNYTRYRNKLFDEWYKTAVITPDDGVRIALYKRMDSLMMDDAPVIPLWYDMVLHLVNPWVKNFHPNSLNLLELRRVMKEK